MKKNKVTQIINPIEIVFAPHILAFKDSIIHLN